LIRLSLRLRKKWLYSILKESEKAFERKGHKMLKNKMLLLLICLNFILPVFVFGAEKKAWQPLNANQPISIGERIYSAQVRKGDVAKGVVYDYDGCDGSSIKIKITKITVSARFLNEEIPELRTLPINANKQSLLKVKTFNDFEPNMEILITVADDFYRITAEEYKS